MFNKFKSTLFLVLTLLSAPILANPSLDKTDPFQLVQTVAHDLFERISAEQGKIQSDPEVLRVVVAEQLAPSINHKYAAAMVLGTHYKKVSKKQRDEFFSAFKTYLIATYAGILTLYTDQKVIFEPAYDLTNKKIAVVKTRVLDEGKPDISLAFKLRKNRKTGEWSAYDMIAEGVSVLDSKRAELQNLIRQQGIDSVTQLLLDKAAKPIKIKTIGSGQS